MEPRHLVGQAVCGDDHRRWCVGRLVEECAPLRDQLTVAREQDRLRRIGWDVRRDLPTSVVLERPGHELSRYRGRTRWFARCFGTASADGRFVVHLISPAT